MTMRERVAANLMNMNGYLSWPSELMMIKLFLLATAAYHVTMATIDTTAKKTM